MKIENAIQLKKYIYQNELICEILGEIGCENVRYSNDNKWIRCTNPDGDNPLAVKIKNSEYLNMINYTRNFGKNNPDLLDLVTYAMGFTKLSETTKYLCELLELEYIPFNYKNKRWNKSKSHIAIKQSITEMESEQPQNQIEIDEKILDSYTPMLHIDWIREGIMPWTKEKFDIRYSHKENRIIIPIRQYDTGKLLALSKRTTQDYSEAFCIPKYLVTKSYRKSLNVFGVWENRESIKEAKRVVIFEAEKSVFKRDSLNDSTGVALQGHFMSDTQVNILMDLGEEIEILIAMDKDVHIDEVRFMCEKFYKKRKVSYIYDVDELLDEKDSPADKGNKIFQELFNRKIKYDEYEHQQYLKSIRKDTKQLISEDNIRSLLKNKQITKDVLLLGIAMICDKLEFADNLRCEDILNNQRLKFARVLTNNGISKEEIKKYEQYRSTVYFAFSYLNEIYDLIMTADYTYIEDTTEEAFT